MPTPPATGLATAISILFAYFTNRRWVFESRAEGRAAWMEFGAFVACRLSTLLLDMAFMGVTVDFLACALDRRGRGKELDALEKRHEAGLQRGGGGGQLRAQQARDLQEEVRRRRPNGAVLC